MNLKVKQLTGESTEYSGNDATDISSDIERDCILGYLEGNYYDVSSAVSRKNLFSKPSPRFHGAAGHNVKKRVQNAPPGNGSDSVGPVAPHRSEFVVPKEILLSFCPSGSARNFADRLTYLLELETSSDGQAPTIKLDYGAYPDFEHEVRIRAAGWVEQLRVSKKQYR